MKTLTAEQQLQHAAATTCKLCHGQFTKKNKKTKHHWHLSGLYISQYCNTCNLKLKYKRFQLRSDRLKEEESIKEETDQVLQRHIQKIQQQSERHCWR